MRAKFLKPSFIRFREQAFHAQDYGSRLLHYPGGIHPLRQFGRRQGLCPRTIFSNQAVPPTCCLHAPIMSCTTLDLCSGGLSRTDHNAAWNCCGFSSLDCIGIGFPTHQAVLQQFLLIPPPSLSSALESVSTESQSIFQLLSRLRSPTLLMLDVSLLFCWHKGLCSAITRPVP
jgi:hypothetical protein